MKEFDAQGLHCMCTAIAHTDQIIYVLAPHELRTHNLSFWANECKANIVIVYGMQYERGQYAEMLDHLISHVFPTLEEALGYEKTPQRSLLGVDLAGVFALYAWLKSDSVRNFCFLSEPMHHPQVVSWLRREEIIPQKGLGLIYLLDHSHEEALSDSDETLHQAVEILRQKGAPIHLQLVAPDRELQLEPLVRQFFEMLID